MTTIDTGQTSDPTGQSAGKGLSLTMKIGLPLLVVAISALAYQSFKSFYIPAYGENPEELAYLEDADPRALLGGDLTHFKYGDVSFSEPAANLPWQLVKKFDDGDGHFERPFKEATLSSQGANSDGLGPIYNNNACESCHEADGRTTPVVGGSLLVRLSVPGENEHGGPKPHPVYGGQFGDLAVGKAAPEGRVEVLYSDVEGYYGDGERYILRKPEVVLTDLGYGPLGEETMTSARSAPSVFGVGLLEAIDDDALREWADPEDADGDGISGRLNMVWDSKDGRQAIGRFGWKAEQPTVFNQVADAASNDMGVTSPVFPNQTCMPAQTDCIEAIHGGDAKETEFTYAQVDEATAYLQLLSVPARGHLDEPTVQRGEKLFSDSGCTGCHKPLVVTGDDHELRRLRGQTIMPYTDLLLHDMGEGLADNRPSFEASGREWRTAPLWGIGMTETVNRHTLFLHDGRARGFAEAILWHGGEAEAAKEKFRNLPKEDRESLIKFLRSL